MPTRRPLTVGVVAARATAGLVTTTGDPAAAAPPDGPPATYIVTVDRWTPPSQAAERARGIGGRIDHVYTTALRGYAVTLSETAASRLASQLGVVAVERNQVVSVDAMQTGATWGLDRIDQQDLPLSTTYSWTATGTR